MPKHKSLYVLFDDGNKPTTNSQYYGRGSKVMWQVVAYSAKQAVYLAHNRQDYKPGGVGIVAYDCGVAGRKIRYYDGREDTCYFTPRPAHRITDEEIEDNGRK